MHDEAGARARIDFAGNYSQSIATRGVAPTVVMRFATAAAGPFTATMCPPRPLVRDPRSGSLDTVYGTAGANDDANVGTVVVLA